MPMGPLTLADTVGLDICLSVATILSNELDVAVPESLKTMVQKGNLGIKSGFGFYEYKTGKKVEAKQEDYHVDEKVLTDRLIGRMTNESVACLRENVVVDKDLLDAGVIFGTGFAPFRGGPINYVAKEGYEAYKNRLDAMEIRYGSSFKPDDGWGNLITD
jgi:3-hydroxyacyl-CoA dehydrogenase/enoyl-CoA hydratase/3-hydroxybutyryl-CoA epimerase